MYVLQWATTVVQSSTYCAQPFFSNFTFNPAVHLCAVDYPYDDTGTCSGDSGGPLLAADAAGRPVEIGVTSVGPANCNTVTADYFTAVLPLSSWANSWINAVAPAPPPPPAPPAPASTAASAACRDDATASRSVTASASADDGLRRPLRTRARRSPACSPARSNTSTPTSTSCTRKSAVRISCNFSFWSGPNDYWGTVTVHYLFGSNNSLEWTDRYTMRWVNDQCYFHSTHRSRCRITTRSGSW